ncbi:hypothetical protein ACFVP3_02580 [Streptomyces sp. NPDC057806]|uniref:hypothetical protein n=1 Tax=Streptomyces sp. NPDC057806 TaxID=3346255 RepID=UPI0036A89762
MDEPSPVLGAVAFAGEFGPSYAGVFTDSADPGTASSIANKTPEYVDPAAPDLVRGLRARGRAAGPRRESGRLTSDRWNLANLGTGHRPVSARARSRPRELAVILA